MYRITLVSLFLITFSLLQAQDVSELEKENGFYNIHFYSVVTDFKAPEKLQNTNGDYYKLQPSPKRLAFLDWAIGNEEVHLVKDTVRDITISLIANEKEGAFKQFLEGCAAKYGKVTRQIETSTTLIYIWESPSISFSVVSNTTAAEPAKPSVKVVYSSLSR